MSAPNDSTPTDDTVAPTENDGPTARESRDPWVGTVLGERYVVERRLGAGGMGVVYLGRQLSVDRPVAVKILPEAYSDSAELVRRFMREAKVASALSHPNSVTLHDFGQTPSGALYLVMELVVGETLEAHLHRVGRIPVPRAVAIALQLLDALDEAHGRGIIHRDLKPGNIMLSPRAGQPDFVKLLDFGLARNDEAGSGDTTQTGAIMGTPAYMSPEQGRGHRCDARTDLYALGVVLFEMLAGQRPFAGPSNLALLLKHFSEPPPRLSDCRPDLAGLPDLEAIVARALAKEREDRFADAREMHNALAAAAQVSVAPGAVRPAVAGPSASRPGGVAPAVPDTMPDVAPLSAPPTTPDVIGVDATAPTMDLSPPASTAPRRGSPTWLVGGLALGAAAAWWAWPVTPPAPAVTAPTAPASPPASAAPSPTTTAPASVLPPTAPPTTAPPTSPPEPPASAAPPVSAAPPKKSPRPPPPQKPPRPRDTPAAPSAPDSIPDLR